MVVYSNPLRREKSGRAKRIIKWFADQDAAKTYAREINSKLATSGTEGVAFDAALRADAVGARQILDVAGHDLTLTELARAYAARVAPSRAARLPIAQAIEDFLDHKRQAENRTHRAVDNLSTRIYRWAESAALSWVGDIRSRAMPAPYSPRMM